MHGGRASKLYGARDDLALASASQWCLPEQSAHTLAPYLPATTVLSAGSDVTSSFFGTFRAGRSLPKFVCTLNLEREEEALGALEGMNMNGPGCCCCTPPPPLQYSLGRGGSCFFISQPARPINGA